MKGLKLSLIVLTATLLAVGLSGMAYAFHSGGVGRCEGCHSMHQPEDTTSQHLLAFADSSSTCLDCHAGSSLGSHAAMTYPDPGAGVAPVNYTPGGDFLYLLKTYSFTGRSGTSIENGNTHGHNVIAADQGLTVTSQWAQGPGGTFNSADLTCTSCHDPHGKYRRDENGVFTRTGFPIIASGSTGTVPAANQAVGAYRILAGQGYTQNAGAITPGFLGVPIAVSPSTYNQPESTNQVRIAYGVSGTADGKTSWGNWCGACHADYHSTGNYVHPVDQQLGNLATTYDQYIKSGDMNGNHASSFLSLVPFMQNTSDYTLLSANASNTVATSAGPATSDQVSCLSCHRAHASPFPSMLRWGMDNEFMVSNGVYQIESRGRSNAEAIAAYYGRPVTAFASYQRVLCNKCHAQD
jgi:predicted CXXCH cytochrome family protein